MIELRETMVRIYNTPVEIGIRSLIILGSAENRQMDIEKIMYLDYLCLNTSDVNGPPSLHAPIPNRGVQVFSKKDLIQKGLSIMISKELINLVIEQKGFFYEISEAGKLFLGLFHTKYFNDLSARTKWVLESWGDLSTDEIKLYIDNNIQKWGGDFLAVEEKGNL